MVNVQMKLSDDRYEPFINPWFMCSWWQVTGLLATPANSAMIYTANVDEYLCESCVVASDCLRHFVISSSVKHWHNCRCRCDITLYGRLSSDMRGKVFRWPFSTVNKQAGLTSPYRTISTCFTSENRKYCCWSLTPWSWKAFHFHPYLGIPRWLVVTGNGGRVTKVSFVLVLGLG